MRVLMATALAVQLALVSSVAQVPPAQNTSGPVAFDTLAYPPVAIAGRVEGSVVVRTHITEEGSVAGAVPISGPELLRDVVTNNARTWRFRSGQARDVFLTYFFELDGYCYRTPQPTLMRIVPPYDVVKVTSCHSWAP